MQWFAYGSTIRFDVSRLHELERTYVIRVLEMIVVLLTYFAKTFATDLFCQQHLQHLVWYSHSLCLDTVDLKTPEE